MLQLLEKVWKTSLSSSELIPCHFLASVAQIDFFSSHLIIFSVTRGLAPQGRGCAPLAPYAPGARGLLGKRFLASPKSGNSRKRVGWRVPLFCNTLRWRGAPTRPSLNWGAPRRPHDFPNFSWKNQNFNFNCCLVSISGLVFSNLLFHYFSMRYHWCNFSITMTEIRNMNIKIQMTNLKIIMMNCITCLYY